MRSRKPMQSIIIQISRRFMFNIYGCKDNKVWRQFSMILSLKSIKKTVKLIYQEYKMWLQYFFVDTKRIMFKT